MLKKFRVLLLSSTLLFSESIEQKIQSAKASNEETSGDKLSIVNQSLKDLRLKLKEQYDLAKQCVDFQQEEGRFREILGEIKKLRQKIYQTEDQWKNISIDQNNFAEEGYALWDQEDISLSQLIMEYGGGDYLYLVPAEMSNFKLHLHSDLPIPRESWSDLLEIILSANGIGVKPLNAFARQLFLYKQDFSSVDSIVTKTEDLELFSKQSRLIFVLNPLAERAKAVAQFFERFRDPKATTVYQVDCKVVIVSTKEELKRLLKLYETVWDESEEKISRVFSLSKVNAKEMEKILKSYFEDSKRRMTLTRGQNEDLTIMPVGHEGSLAVIGIRRLVEKAEEIIAETEKQVESPTEMTVYWYTCKHSDPIEVSNVLEKVYKSLISAKIDSPEEKQAPKPINSLVDQGPPPYGPPGPPPVVNAPIAAPTTAKEQEKSSNTMNFIPYPKSGAIMMVVRKDTLGKLKELIRKLDTPKKMVQIEVLLFEKTINTQNNFGLNLLRIGANAKHIRETGLDYDFPKTNGILEFFMSRPAFKHFPAFDLAYNFLMSQDDVRINASPSILTLNQTPAQFSNVEQISINNGAAPIETNTGITFENSFVRAEYGITIVITPTIHEPIEEEGDTKRFVSLETNVTFDTTKDRGNDRPDVNRRHIENTVRIIDGETVILGGLQRKISEDNSDKIPFLGELPGLGKFFATSKLADKQTELFIFITPHVIEENEDHMRSMRDKRVRMRPGDLPEFLQRIEEAKAQEKRKLFANSFRLLFGGADDV